MIHKLAHLLRLNRIMHELWWIQIPNGKKLMCGNRCIKCGKIDDIKPTGIELEFESYP